MSQNFVRIGFFVSFATAVIVFIVGWMQPVSATPITADITSFNVFAHGALFSAAVLWLLGVEMPFTMGDEYSQHRKTAGTMLLWGSLALMAGYLMGTAGILWAMPMAKVDVTKGVAQAISAHYPLLGSAVALAIWVAVMSQDIAYLNAYSRLLFVSAVEKRMPKIFAEVNERKVPVRALFAQGLGAPIVVLIFATLNSAGAAFNLYLATLVAIWCASLYYIYGAVILSRKKYADLYKTRGDDVWKIPGGKTGAWVVALWGIIANTIAIYYVFALPWVTDGISAFGWRIWIAAISFIVIVLGILLYQHSLKQQKS
jgi:amino acid transporter